MSYRFYSASLSNQLTCKRPNPALPAARARRLLTLFTLLSVQFSVQASYGSTCRSFFSGEALPTLARTLPEAPPKIHTKNMEQLYAELDLRRGTVEMERVTPHPKLDILCTNLQACFRIVGEKPADGQSIKLVVKDSDGRKFTVLAEPIGGNIWHPMAGPPRNYLRVFMHQRESAPEPSFDFESRRSALRERFQNDGWENLTLEQLAKKLTDLHLNRSTNRRHAKNIIEYDSGVREANTLIAKRLVSKEEITESDLIQLNKALLKGVYPFRDSYFHPIAGVLRGSADQVAIHDGKLYVVDMRDRQSFQMLSTPSERLTTLTFAPADQVSTLLRDLLKDANQVSETTSMEKIFSIYQEYIKIHPFADGNGRVARVLLNFMLLKAKLPIPRYSPETLYFSPKEVAQEYTDGILDDLFP